MPLDVVDIARRYAKALFDLIKEGEHDASKQKASAQKILEELQVFDSALDSQAFFLSPIISKADKKEVLLDLKDRLPLTHRFLNVLVDANRMVYFSEITAEFARRLEELSGEIHVELELAAPISESLTHEIRNLLQDKWQKQIRLSKIMKPELIGGFVAKAPGRMVDASILSQLNILSTDIKGNEINGNSSR